MNREYEFRAWDKKRKFMMWDVAPYYLETWDKDTFELTQYTGKKDINDKKIFDGDIAEEYVEGMGTGRVFEIRWDKEWLTYKFGKGMLADIECKVIGDIYRNPNLIQHSPIN